MKGSCLCGGVTVESPDVKDVSVCHCTMCFKWNSGPNFTLHCGPHVPVEINGSVTVYESSDWGSRGFCSKCGTHLYYFLKPANEYIFGSGLFNHHDFKVKSEIFIDEKPQMYDLKDAETVKLTGEQVMSGATQ